MMANTTQDSAGMPWNRDRIGDRNRSMVRERTISNASSPPTMKAPASPARMRNTVASTSANIDPVEKISMQRQNTSISDGNRKRGKNSEANCQSNITTPKGNTDSTSRLAMPNRLAASGDIPARGMASLIRPRSLPGRLIDGRSRRVRRQEGDGSPRGVHRIDLLADLGGPLHIHAEPVIGAHQIRDRLLVIRRALRRDQLRRLVRVG